MSPNHTSKPARDQTQGSIQGRRGLGISQLDSICKLMSSCPTPKQTKKKTKTQWRSKKGDKPLWSEQLHHYNGVLFAIRCSTVALRRDLPQQNRGALAVLCLRWLWKRIWTACRYWVWGSCVSVLKRCTSSSLCCLATPFYPQSGKVGIHWLSRVLKTEAEIFQVNHICAIDSAVEKSANGQS